MIHYPTSIQFPLSPDPIFWTLQGEAHLRGFQMALLRLAGCSVGCDGCDTNYRVDSRATMIEIVARLREVVPRGVRDRWVWITGGEPTDHDIKPLVSYLKLNGWSVALATSGVRRVIIPVDWLSVSPHTADPAKFIQRYGNEIKLSEGLNGLNLDDWYAQFPDSETDFMYRYVQPLWVGDPATGHEDPASLARCVAFLRDHPNWSLSRQDHKLWGAP